MRETGLSKSEKQIDDGTLMAILLSSLDKPAVRTPLLPKGCIFYLKYSNTRELYVLECDKWNYDFDYHGTKYSAVGVPRHLFFITTCGNQIVGTKIAAVKDYFIQPETVLHRWPFSNVHVDFSVCWGSARLPVIEEAYQLSGIPRLFFAQGNTDCNYAGSNASGLEYRHLLHELQNKEFNDNWLLPSGYKFKDLIPKEEEDENEGSGQLI